VYNRLCPAIVCVLMQPIECDRHPTHPPLETALLATVNRKLDF
jgi:hypothetical protein